MRVGPGPMVVAVDEQCEIPVELEPLRALALAVLRAQRVQAGELNLILVSRDDMQELNRTHMANDRPTDVLSFPLDGDDPDEHATLIGDVVICPAHAAGNAAAHAGIDHHSGSVADELALLVVHGILHILGYDHVAADDAVRMEALEQDLLEAHHR